ncbi:hypothetical protein J31TS4_00920 [Paenibacillus sp. J31TS4]|uniref:flagellar export protein FliJ n=1 Tax=Paenibacillus sp. J31TS4 TaxID=2807195 RepID=UPI001B183482|nr:flagellar export protein FliJ [Paenibacillus sp. J31TS4]GIP36812.1 hypothetical protein J31TS4_00920 [Paenibacillus sp. J31TS4]
MKFRYAFQKIVDLKTSEKTQAEWTFTTSVGVLRDEEASLATLFSEKKELQQHLQEEAGQTTTVSQLLLYQSYLDHIEAKIREKNRDVRQARQTVDANQQVLNAKLLEEKVWATARDKAKEVHVAEVLRQEQAALDEIASVRYRSGL